MEMPNAYYFIFVLDSTKQPNYVRVKYGVRKHKMASGEYSVESKINLLHVFLVFSH